MSGLDIVWLVVAAVPAIMAVFLLQVFLHETSHVLVASALGYSIDEFQPWPHVKRDRLYFGRMSLTEPIRHAAIPIAPLWWDGSQMVLCSVLGLVWWPFWALAASALIDALWWLYGLTKPERYWLDAQRWRQMPSD